MDLHRRARFYVLETAHDGENTFAETRGTSFVVCTLALARAPLRVRVRFSCWLGGVKTRHGPPMAMHPAPYALGVLGAVPFVGLTPQARRALGYESVVTPETTARLQIGYGASILSFLGGIHWGLGAIGHSVVRDLPPTPAQLTTRYAWSVTPSLLAWQASLMSSEIMACGTLIGGLLTCAGVDTAYAKAGGYPKWLIPLRYGLTAAATMSLAATAFRGVEQHEKK